MSQIAASVNNAVIFCYCDCHKPWGSTVPPICICSCRNGLNIPLSTANLCKHGSSTAGCLQCADEHEFVLLKSQLSNRIDELSSNHEKLIEHSQDGIEKCLEWIEHVEYKHDKFVEAIKHYALGDMSEKVIEHESRIDRWSDTLNHVQSNIVDEMNQFDKKIKHLEAQIKELTRFQDITHEQYKYICKKKSHKCKSCYGTGLEIISLSVDDKHNIFKATHDNCGNCNGKGFVWS